MSPHILNPLIGVSAEQLKHCKLGTHVGTARLPEHGDDDHPTKKMVQHFRQLTRQEVAHSSTLDYEATCFVPACGPALIALRHSSEDPLTREFGKSLTVVGQSPDGPFRLHCPQYYVKVTSGREAKPFWAIAAPVNAPTTIDYGAPRTIARVEAIINNFDFQYGNHDQGAPSSKIVLPKNILRVQAAGRPIDFSWRADRQQLRDLADAGLLRSAAFTKFSFAAWEGASEEDLITFAQDVASLCTFAIGQHSGVPVLTFLDGNGEVVKRFVWQSMESRVRRGGVLDNSEIPTGLPGFFAQCFEEHVRMRHSPLPWRRLPFVCAAIEDPPYLEQKFASLMMALEFFINNSLRDRPDSLTQTQIEGLQLPGLLGHARRVLGWDIPGHYTARELYRLLRNAVMHGGELPTKDAAVFRHNFDKWRLFLARRALIRLGYTGKIHSPVSGFGGLSQVDDFSEEGNSFEPR
jgi:hypothetical protein